MLHDDDRLVSVKLCYGGTAKFAKGGLAAAGQAVSDAGRFGDEMVVHINRREFDELRQKWGDPHVNPDTGLPEFWNLKDVWHAVKPYVAPVGAAAAGAFLPGIGSAVGSVLPGVASVLGTTGTQALATGLLGAGAGALLNGGKGAIYGGLGGVLGSYGGDLLQNGASSAIGSLLGGGAGNLDSAAAESILGGGGGSGAAAGLLDSLGGGGGSGSKIGSAALMAALDLAGNALDKGNTDKAAKKAQQQAQAQFNAPLPVYNDPRKRTAYTGVPDYTTQGEVNYFDNNHFADGGSVAEGGGTGYVHNTTGDSGRSDKIKALLSPNEYVVDAETTALLGDGSPEAGAKRLDEMRSAVRAHKGSALAQGQISPDALHPLQYLGMK